MTIRGFRTTPISAAITTRAIRGEERYEATYDGIRTVNLYKIEILNNNQEIKTHLTSITVNQGDIQGWGGLTDKMQELIDHHISPLLKEIKT
jgi:hypothetical protein